MAVVEVRNGVGSGSLQEDVFADISAELKERLGEVRCPVHRVEPTIIATVRWGGMVDIELSACCTELQSSVDRLLVRYMR